MDSPMIPFPPDADGGADADDLVVAEIDAAIAMVAGLHATRVRLVALPFVERVAGIGAAHAHAASVAFRVERTELAGVLTVTVGPRE